MVLIRKYVVAAAMVLFCIVTGANAQQGIFPAQQTAQNGVTSYGYLSESGEIILPFSFESASDFSESGLAAVENTKHETGVIDLDGSLVVGYREAPVTVEFGDDQIAYRYETYTDFFTNSGEYLGAFPDASGFFCDGRLLVSTKGSAPYYYYQKDGTLAIKEGFVRAGIFENGYALVQRSDNAYYVINQYGAVQAKVEDGYTPVYMELYGNTIVVQGGSQYYLYSVESGTVYSDGFSFISSFDNAVATVKSGTNWGLITTSGSFRVEPSYYSMTYLGDSVYAARALDGSVMAVDEYGNSIYRTSTFVGGFGALRYGICWHGTEDGNIIFFTKSGGYLTSLINAENPYLLSENIVRVTQDGKLTYINLATGNVIYTPPDSYALGGGLTAQTQKYYKFLGYAENGAAYDWDVSFPVISGIPDSKVQTEINDQIYDFFLKGPSITAEYIALRGTYGVSLEGSVLVVWANCVSGVGEGAAVWNQSIAFDTRTGEQYKLSDLLTGEYMSEIQEILPGTRAFYLYENPRLSTSGITYFYNEYESASRRASTESFFISFSELGRFLDTSGDCYKALKTPYEVQAVSRFSDVPSDHWAYDAIEQVSQLGFMQGYGGYFRPATTISEAEAAAVAVRAQGLTASGAIADGIDSTKWYAREVSTAMEAGYLDGFEIFNPAAAITRQDAMQIFANIITRSEGQKLDPSRQMDTDTTLASFTDADSIAAERREAVAVCVRAGLVEGDNGLIRPEESLTRAQYAKLILAVYQDVWNEMDVQEDAG